MLPKPMNAAELAKDREAGRANREKYKKMMIGHTVLKVKPGGSHYG